MKPIRRAVAIGGGHGLSRTLQALTLVADDTTAIVTVADDGGSSGRLRRDLDVVPPGDMRMALAALASNEALASLLQYRFETGELAGHALGNLMIVAMTDLASGGLLEALGTLGRELGIPGRVLPCTTTPLVLHGEGPAGPVAGQAAVGRSGPPRRVWLEPADSTVAPGVAEAIAEADLIVLGPGSIYTSILPNLLVPGVASAVLAAQAPVVLVANMREQWGETEGMTLADHLDALCSHVPDLVLDAVVAHDGVRPSGVGAALDPEVLEVHPRVRRLVTAALLDGDDGHDPAGLARELAQLVDNPSRSEEP